MSEQMEVAEVEAKVFESINRKATTSSQYETEQSVILSTERHEEEKEVSFGI